MARIRTVKPEFFTSEDIVELQPLARLLYIALWCEADKEGRLPWKPKTFKMRYLPGDNCDIEEVCDALIDSGLVRLYGEGLAYIPTFLRHQHINPRESASVLPAPEDCPPAMPKKITSSVRADVFERDGHACVRCGSKDKLTLDHILPQSLGGPHIQENLRCMCRSCNSGRPVSGQALRDDLAKDGFTVEGLRVKFGIDASRRVATREVQEMTRREEGRKEGKGKEGKEQLPDAGAPDVVIERRKENLDAIEGQLDAALPVVAPSQEHQAGVVFEHWKLVMDSARSIFDDKRKGLIKKALKMGYQVEDLCAAIDGCKKSDFHMARGEYVGKNKHNGLDLILRDAAKIDQFITIGRSPRVPMPAAPTRPGAASITMMRPNGSDYSSSAAAAARTQAQYNIQVDGDLDF